MAIKNTPQAGPNQGQEDENKVLKYGELVQTNRNKIVTISLAVIALAIVVIFLRNSMEETAEEQKNQASVSLDRIMPYVQRADYEKALNGDPETKVRGEDVIGLIEIVNEFRDTDQGKMAAFYAGDVYLQMGQPDMAIDYFDIALNSTSRVILSGANAGLGAVYETKKEYDKAAEYFEKAATNAESEDAEMRYRYYMAMNMELGGKSEEAEKIYREISEKAKFSEFGKFSKIALQRLGTIIE